MTIFLKIRYYKLFERIDVREGTDPVKSNKSKECMIRHDWFFNHGFKFQDFLCNGCHRLTILSVNISDIAVTIIKNVNYCFIIHNSKSEVINLLESSVVEDYGYIKKNIVLIFSLLQTKYIKYLYINI